MTINTEQLKSMTAREGLKLREARNPEQARRWCGQLALFDARGSFLYASNDPENVRAFLYHHDATKRG
ncbi:hypothetical protein K3217_05295 [bacterium BD-1]|nr:hypothetical protein [Ottowia caeni]